MQDPMAPFNWAQKEIGTAETPDPTTQNPRIVWYDSFTTLKATNDETPWCSAFMCAAAENNGYPSTRSAAASSWETYGVAGSGRVGDIAVFSRPGGHHVAFVAAPYKAGDHVIKCLGGNQGNQVCEEYLLAAHLIVLRRFP